jgi:L-2-hydroxyglutarate oxidase LhgO
MKIAILGAGVFGCTLALVLSKNKSYKIHLYEKKSDIMQMASKYNQQRFHHGFHYPRSQKTFNEISKSRASFEKFFGKKYLEKQKIIMA